MRDTLENRIADLADKLDISYGEAERMLMPATPKKRSNRSRVSSAPRVKREKSNLPSYDKVLRMAKAAGRDWAADCACWAASEHNSEPTESFPEDAAYDIADSLLYNPDIHERMVRYLTKFNGYRPSRQLMKEILGDYVHEGATTTRKQRRAA